MNRWTMFSSLSLLACATAGGVAGNPAGGCVSPAPERATSGIELDTGTGVLAGTLELPAGCPPFPVVLIHAGSGPTDRDGNSAGLPRNDSLKLLAEALSGRGIASVRYDKRGIAASRAAGPSSERDYRLATLVSDAAAWVTRVAADRRFSRVVFLGHSEGSLIGTQAARVVSLDGFVAVAGPGRPLGEVVREQLRRGLTGELLARALQILTELEAGGEVDDVPGPLLPLFRPSVQPYVIEELAVDPRRGVAELAAPVLVVQGTSDLQVSVIDAQQLAAARPGTELVLIEGMNHVLKAAGPDTASQSRAYTDPTLPVVEQAVQAVAAFVERTRR
jgi:pimeloyl-ACP methyl ester carboxylesterase